MCKCSLLINKHQLGLSGRASFGGGGHLALLDKLLPPLKFLDKSVNNSWKCARSHLRESNFLKGKTWKCTKSHLSESRFQQFWEASNFNLKIHQKPNESLNCVNFLGTGLHTYGLCTLFSHIIFMQQLPPYILVPPPLSAFLNESLSGGQEKCIFHYLKSGCDPYLHEQKWRAAWNALLEFFFLNSVI